MLWHDCCIMFYREMPLSLFVFVFKKKSLAGGTIVKSRYMQAAEKTSLSKVIHFFSQLILVTGLPDVYHLIHVFNKHSNRDDSADAWF